MAKGNHNIGSKSAATSYPDPELAGSIGASSTSLGNAAGGNYNANNFDCDPPVFNESPATRKNYSWNRGETGNAT
jgi:hypothetical protein